MIKITRLLLVALLICMGSISVYGADKAEKVEEPEVTEQAPESSEEAAPATEEPVQDAEQVEEPVEEAPVE